MSQSGIEWTDWTLNPVKGKCPVACPYCYARKMYDRFRWNPKIRFCPSVFNDLPRKPVKVFVGSTMELFLFDDWMEFILNRCQDFPQHTFLFLTKKPQNLIKWSPFPDNCWVGVTATDNYMFKDAMKGLIDIKAKVKYISFEPLLSEVFVDPISFQGAMGWRHPNAKALIDGVIIGALKGKKSKIMELAKQYLELTPMPWGSKWTLQPKIEWVEEIVRVADQAGIPVFLKDNLAPLLASRGLSERPSQNLLNAHRAMLRQEMPDISH